MQKLWVNLFGLHIIPANQSLYGSHCTSHQIGDLSVKFCYQMIFFLTMATSSLEH